MTSPLPDNARDWLRPPLVCLVTDGRADQTSLLDRVEAAVAGGVRLVQLREKQRPAVELLDLAYRLHERLRGQAALVVNDRLDVALAAGVEGVHLPSAGLPPAVARSLAPQVLIGRSVHDPGEADAAGADEVDYLILGTIFATRTHPGGLLGGLELVRATRSRTRLPLLAIGGITAENAASALEAGADGVAVVSAILDAADPRCAAADLLQAVQAGWLQRIQEHRVPA